MTTPDARHHSEATGSAATASGGRESWYRWPAVRAVAVALPLTLALPVLGRAWLSVPDYWIDVAFTTATFVFFIAALARFDAISRAAVRLVESYRVGVLAGLFLAAAIVVAFLVFDHVPHVSDEVAYQFQAGALAAGRLAVDAPAQPEFFDFVHTIVDGGRWYGIMNPGWPALLAVGELAGVPWLVNPVLGAATILVFFAFFRRIGYDPLEARTAVLLMAVSPFMLFMSGTLMAHTANLLLFGIFAWACAASLQTERLRFALIAGLALAVNLLVRPIDTAAASLPFIAYIAYRAVRRPRMLGHVALAGLIAASAVAATMLYNHALTGDFQLMPMTKYFMDRNPAEKFGLGFGADMGTTMHGPEWPGYYPIDGVRVTAYRLAQLLVDVQALPLLLLAVTLYPLFRRSQLRHRGHALLLASAVCLAGAYFLHFYHGVAYGSRHYFLALPAIAVLIARPLAGWIRSDNAATARRARLVLAAGLLYTVSVPYARLLPEYSDRYREASGLVRDTVAEQGLSDALVFVHPEHWAWKSAFPLNEYPLESNDVLFAKHRGDENATIIERFPGRTVYSLRIVSTTSVEITPFTPAPADGSAGGQ